MGIELIHPTIILLLSDLRNGLGEGSGPGSEQLTRAELFLQKFRRKISPAEIETLLNKEQTSEIVDLMNPQDYFEAPHDGCHQPLQIDDTYCLISNYSGPKTAENQPNYAPQPIDSLRKHWGLDRSPYPATLGETWLYQAQIANSQDAPKDVAQAIYQEIVRNAPEIWSDPAAAWSNNLKGHGTWQGGYIYELWVDRLTPIPDLLQHIPQTPHILIWLFPSSLKPEIVSNQASQNYQNLLQLCRYRHKILAAAHNSYHYSAELKKDYSVVVQYLQEMRQGNMSDRQLQDILIKLTDFTYRLDLLKSQSPTIETNLSNYSHRLQTIQKADPSGDLDFFKVFSTADRYTPKYLKQIATDYEQLASSREILQILSQTVQGCIAINQTKVDRTTNITIASIATGIAASQLLSAVITTKKAKLPASQGFIADTINYAPILFTDPILYVSLALSVFFGAVMFVFLRFVPRWWPKASKK
jgi:hypothetical protein